MTPPRFESHDVWVAIAMGSRLPAPVDHARAAARVAAAAWAAPLLGVLIGAIGAAAFAVLLLVGAPALGAAFFAIGAQLIATGALHEDGLADSADGLGAGGAPERILEIMRDSRVGAFGAAALFVAIGARAGALGAIDEIAAAFAALLASGAASRGVMAGIWAALAPLGAGDASGLAARAGRPDRVQAAAALTIGAGAAAFAVGAAAAFIGLALAIGLAGGFAVYARRRVGRLNGDFLGASQLIAECALLAVFAGAL